MRADAARRSACATTARQHARSFFHGVSRNEGPSQQARTTVLHFLTGPLDGRVATIGHLAGELDFAGRDLALVAQLDVLIAKLRGDGEGHGIAFHLAVRDGGFAGKRTRRLASDLVAILLEGEGPLHRAVGSFHLAVRDGGFAGKRTRRLASDLVAILLEG